jgi:hypothetical protein
LPARLTFCLVLAASFLLSPTSNGQTEPHKQTAAANPTNREENNGLRAREQVRPVEPTKPSVSVRHLEKKQDGFQVAETAHFRILHDQEKPIVEKIAEAAEKTRASVQKKWFGEEAADWDGKCSIYLHADRAKYSKKTGMKNTLGHMRTIDWGGTFLRSIHVPVKEPNLVADVLPHEVCHSVMAIRFQGKTPRWADEGMAMLAETPASVADCVGKLPRYRKNEGLFAVEVLLQTDEVDHVTSMEYYAQSLSLVQYLSGRKGPQEFTKFLRTCIMKGPEPALKQHFDIQGYGDLEKRWQAFAFEKKK